MLELIFVIVIIGILAGVAVPKMISYKSDALVLKAKEDIANIQTNLEKYSRVQTFANLDEDIGGYPDDKAFKDIVFSKSISKTNNWSINDDGSYGLKVNNSNVTFAYDKVKGLFTCVSPSNLCDLFK